MNSWLEIEISTIVCMLTEQPLCDVYWLPLNSSSMDGCPSIIFINLIQWIWDLMFSSVSSIYSLNSERREPVIPSLINTSLYSLRPILSSSWIT